MKTLTKTISYQIIGNKRKFKNVKDEVLWLNDHINYMQMLIDNLNKTYNERMSEIKTLNDNIRDLNTTINYKDYIIEKEKNKSKKLRKKLRKLKKESKLVIQSESLDQKEELQQLIESLDIKEIHSVYEVLFPGKENTMTKDDPNIELR